MKEIKEKIEDLENKFEQISVRFNLSDKEKEIEVLEKDMEKLNFWDDQKNASNVSQKVAELKDLVKEFKDIEKEIQDIKEILKIVEQGTQEFKELERNCNSLEKRIKEQENKIFLSGKYDKLSAILSIEAGAGGRDAEDWATMLLRMYKKYCDIRKFKVKTLSQSFGEGGGPEGRIGIKDVSIEIKGSYVYGYLKNEQGIHRLVRISPFSSQSLRHTSFAKVEVLPKIPESDISEIEIKPEELRVETYRASGPGGQHVNKRESAVRIIHISTGLKASSQEERLQGLNKQKAMQVLKAKLLRFYQDKKDKEIEKVKGQDISASWGNQRRSYVLHPYKLCKDAQTKVEMTNVEKVLNGEIEEFIQAEIKL